MSLKSKLRQYLNDKLGVTENRILIQSLSSYITLLGGDTISLPISIQNEVLNRIHKNYGIADFNTLIHRNDMMLYNHIVHYYGDTAKAVSSYFEVGVSAAKMISDKLNTPDFKNVLDFGSGYGRVSRFLPYYFKDAQIQVSEVKPIAMEFQKEAFEFGTITHTEITSSFKSDPQDLIIGISVFTHIPVKAFIEWLDILFQNLKENGQLIFTFNDINKCPFGNNGKYHYQEQSEDSSNSGIPDKLDDVSQYGSTFYSQDYIIELLQVHSNKIEITRNFIGTHDAVILTR
jgi:phospholipid N-methyltransferase